MTVSAIIDYGVARSALSIPESAIIREPKGTTFVFVVKEGTAIRQQVDLNQSVNGYYLVKSGLAEGDKVVVSGKKLLKNGIKVKFSAGE
jgi:multidrug efflux pump subunit AcrA (membrane-fusion protein)